MIKDMNFKGNWRDYQARVLEEMDEHFATRYVIAFPGNGVLERLVIEAKSRRVSVVDRRGPLGTNPRER